jgi:hypothetical protein
MRFRNCLILKGLHEHAYRSQKSHRQVTAKSQDYHYSPLDAALKSHFDSRRDHLFGSEAVRKKRQPIAGHKEKLMSFITEQQIFPIQICAFRQWQRAGGAGTFSCTNCGKAVEEAPQPAPATELSAPLIFRLIAEGIEIDPAIFDMKQRAQPCCEGCNDKQKGEIDEDHSPKTDRHDRNMRLSPMADRGHRRVI